MTINSGNYINVVGTQQVAIAASAAVSDAINTYGTTPVAISIPSGWTTSDITFSVLPAIGSTYSNDIVTTAGVYKLTGVAANDYICLEPAIFASINTFKIKTSVAQASGVTLLVQFAPILNVANF